MFSVANNVVSVENILEIHNVDNALTEVARYNARVWYHYISWAVQICLYNLNGLNNDFALMKCFTQRFHKMVKAGIF